LPTYCGSRLRLDHRAARDSTAVERLRAAGAVILGKTNCPEFLMNYETDNAVTGRTNNPWDLSRTSGGSSGGEAAAIASYCSAGGIGSDGGGSIREPAHFCGIAGLKPTPGRCPATGHFPEIAHPGGLLGVGGPIARTAKDVRLLFEVLAGHDPQDPFSAPVPMRNPDLSGLRIGMLERMPGVGVEPSIQEAVREAARKLQEIGIPVEPYEPPFLERATRLWAFFFKELSLTVTREFLDKLHWSGRELWDEVASQPEPSAKDVVENLAVRDKLRGRLLREMENCRALLWPACGITAFRHREREWGPIDYAAAMKPLTPANVLGLPAMVIPFGQTGEGLPVGVQLVGRPWDEELLLEIAVRLEDARGPFPGPVGY
jgi:Asp-tRNA(Asn)/Glu-tRNA(Gln) amidotransferase A subunit family amidase